MRDFHRAILAKSRLFLLHNIRPTEALWGTMLEKELLSQDMLDDIKVKVTPRIRVKVLDRVGVGF